MLGLLLTSLLAVEPLAAEDAAQRLSAVEKWARGRKPQLSAKQARAVDACVELPAVKETGCAQPAKVCAVQEGDFSASGTRTEQHALVLAGQDGASQHLRVWWTTAYEPRRGECDPPESMTKEESPSERALQVAAWRKGHAKEWAACIARAEKDSAMDSEELSCDVVLVNACRKEAYVVCHARNLRQGLATLGKLHRFEF